MKKLILCCMIIGCSAENNQQFENTLTPLTIVPFDISYIDLDYIYCNPDTFVADAIPNNYVIDWNCPPNIIWPPKFIRPNSPEPIVNVIHAH